MKKILFLSFAMLGILPSTVYASASAASSLTSDENPHQPGRVLHAIQKVLAEQKPLALGSPLPKATFYKWENHEPIKGKSAVQHSTEEWLKNTCITVVTVPGFFTPTCDAQICEAAQSELPGVGLTVFAAFDNADVAAAQAQKAQWKTSKNAIEYVGFSTLDLQKSFLYQLGVLAESDESKQTGGSRLSLLANRAAFYFRGGILVAYDVETSNGDTLKTNPQAIHNKWRNELLDSSQEATGY